MYIYTDADCCVRTYINVYGKKKQFSDATKWLPNRSLRVIIIMKVSIDLRSSCERMVVLAKEVFIKFLSNICTQRTHNTISPNDNNFVSISTCLLYFIFRYLTKRRISNMCECVCAYTSMRMPYGDDKKAYNMMWMYVTITQQRDGERNVHEYTKQINLYLCNINRINH